MVNQIADLSVFDVMSLSLSYQPLAVPVFRAGPAAVERRPCILLLLRTPPFFFDSMPMTAEPR
jgi:hypothetical protein